MKDLYSLDVTGPVRTMCGGNTDTDGSEESCVTIAPLGDGAMEIGDSKAPGRTLRFTQAEMDTFVLGYAREHGLF